MPDPSPKPDEQAPDPMKRALGDLARMGGSKPGYVRFAYTLVWTERGYIPVRLEQVTFTEAHVCDDGTGTHSTFVPEPRTKALTRIVNAITRRTMKTHGGWIPPSRGNY